MPYDPQASQAIEDACGVTPLVARIMAGRGISTVKQAREFLTPSLERDWGDPLEIPGLREVADRVERALRSGEQIAVFGDFDVDGISATCLLSLALRELGGKVVPFIPRRFDEGYGLSAAAIERMLDEGRAPNLDKLASMLFVSRSHLCAAFSRETGQSIGRYAKARRIERAKVLLASGDSVAYVAACLGWPRPSAFSQAYKQATGTSPTEWRDAHVG